MVGVIRASGDTPDRLIRTIIVFVDPKNNRYRSAGLPAGDGRLHNLNPS